jgi:hypothetical protein
MAQGNTRARIISHLVYAREKVLKINGLELAQNS